MITLDRLADSLKSRDTIRIWKRVEAQWKQELVIDRAHVGAVTDLKIFDKNTFYTSGDDSRIKRWSKEEDSWKITAVANYRDDKILNFDFSADRSLVTTCDSKKCTVYTTDLEMRSVIPLCDNETQLEKVFYGRSEAANLVLVKHSTGFYVWDMQSSTYTRRVDNIGHFDIW